MKKRKEVIAFICIGFLIVLGFCIYRNNRNDFKIVNSYKMTMDNYESTIIHVVVNKRIYDPEKMFCEIRDYYCELGKEPNKLKICLYDSMKDFKNSVCRTERIFESKKKHSVAKEGLGYFPNSECVITHSVLATIGNFKFYRDFILKKVVVFCIQKVKFPHIF